MNGFPPPPLTYLIYFIYEMYEYITTFEEIPWKEQLQNESDFISSNASLKVNDYCYIDFNEKLFDKSFDVKVNILLF